MDLEDAVAVEPKIDPAAWAGGFNDIFALVAGSSRRLRRGGGRVLPAGLLSQTERKNGWWLAEFAGDVSPDGMQRLLNFYAWSADAARDALRDYVTAGIGARAACWSSMRLASFTCHPGPGSTLAELVSAACQPAESPPACPAPPGHHDHWSRLPSTVRAASKP